MADKVQLIKEEIESYKESMKGLEPHSDFRRGQITAYNQIMQFIDSLPEEPTSEDLEEAASKYMREDFHERSRADFKAGAEWQKQQMMKDAVYGYVSLCHDYPHRRSLVAIEDGLVNYKYAEKIKIIICKTEQQ